MSRSHAIALALIPFLTLGGCVASMLSRRLRDVIFVGLILCALFTEHFDVHFFSMEWYRGSTRGVEISLVEILALSLLCGCLLGRRDDAPRWFWPRSLGCYLLFFFYCVLSVIFTQPQIYGFFELSRMVAAILVVVAVAAYIRGLRQLNLLVWTFSFIVGLEGLWAIKQKIFTHLDRAAGSLDHPNSLSLFLCLSGPLLVAVANAGWSRKVRWPSIAAAFLAGVAVLLTVSRAGIPVFAFAALGATATCMSWRVSPRRLAAYGVLMAAMFGIAAASWKMISKRFDAISLQEEYLDPNVDGRGIYLRLAAAIVREHPFGVGLNNWSYRVSKTYGAQLGFRFVDYDYLKSVYGPNDQIFADSYLAAPAHNVFALTLGELGYAGLALFLLLWFRWFSMAAPFVFLSRTEPRRVVAVGILFCMVGLVGQSMTEWVYRQSPILFTFSILLGTLASLDHLRRRERAASRVRAAPQPAYARTAHLAQV
jgi:hypothetical protein